MKSLYVDDIRNPVTDRDWHVVRTVDQAVNFILHYGLPSYISFDHDLGPDPEPTGFDLAKWIVDASLDNRIVIPDDFKFNVHSANPVGRRNIESLLTGYLEYYRNEKNRHC